MLGSITSFRMLIGGLFLSACLIAQDAAAPLIDSLARRQALTTGKLQLDKFNASSGTRQKLEIGFADDAVSVRYLSDENGVRLGQREFTYSNGDAVPRSSFVDGDHRWIYGHSSPFLAIVMNRNGYPGGVMNARALGFSPFPAVGDFSEFRDRILPESLQRLQISTNGENLVLRAETDDEAVEWEFDSTHDNVPIRVTMSQHGKVVVESRTKYKFFDDAWFPERVEYFRADFQNGEQPVEVIEVHAAEFNKPDHPKKLTPACIGIEPGVNVQYDAAPGQVSFRVWDGNALVNQAEFDAALKSGRVQYGPRLAKEIEELERQRQAGDNLKMIASNLGVGRPKFESAWEKYTREFIARYQLEIDQSERCWQILKDCQQQADRYLLLKKDEIEKLEADLKKLQAATVIAADELKKLQERQQAIEAPIERIFEEKLKPRLEKIPTKSQRQAAELVDSLSEK